MTNEGAQSTRETHPWIAEGERTIRYGILSNLRLSWEQLLEEVLFIETLGYDSAWIYDHPIIFGAADCWTTLAMLAATTKRIRLIASVSCICYRNPVLLARMAADVDRVSHGRLVLGLGIGDDPGEFEKLGLPFPNVRERQAMLEETLQIVQGLWRGEPLTFQGTYFQVQQATGHPLPMQLPRVPMLIGGGGERVTLRQVAQYADMSNFGPHIWTGSAFSFEDAERKYRVLNTYCETFARPYNTILRSYYVPALVIAHTQAELAAKLLLYPLRESTVRGGVVGTPEEVRTHFQMLVDLGIQYFVLGVSSGDIETLEIFAREIMPAIQHP